MPVCPHYHRPLCVCVSSWLFSLFLFCFCFVRRSRFIWLLFVPFVYVTDRYFYIFFLLGVPVSSWVLLFLFSV